MKSLLIQGYEVVIGFETHAQLSTQSKIFSRAPTAFGAEPNTQACPVVLNVAHQYQLNTDWHKAYPEMASL